MKKRYLFCGLGVILLFLIIGVVFFLKKYYSEQETFGEIYSSYYNYLETDLEEIKSNLELYSDLKTEDAILLNTYNSLIVDINSCYENSDFLSYKDKKSISKENLMKLDTGDFCLKKFDKYSSMKLSSDDHLSDTIKAKVAIIIDYEMDIKNLKTFKDLLYREITTINRIANLSRWINFEFITYVEN